MLSSFESHAHALSEILLERRPLMVYRLASRGAMRAGIWRMFWLMRRCGSHPAAPGDGFLCATAAWEQDTGHNDDGMRRRERR